MSFKKQKTSSAQTSVATPTNPGWVDNDTAALGGRIASLASYDPYATIAGVDPLQAQASTGASQLGTDRGWSDSIMGSKSPSVLDNLSAYMNPYTNDVVNSSLADFDHNAGATRAQQTLQAAGSGAFGGSGSALTQSATEDSLARARATLGSGLRDQAFTAGAGLAGQDANLSLQHQQLLSQLGLGLETSDRANIGTQSDIGAINRGITQQQINAPISLLQQQLGMFNQLPLGLFHGQNTNSTGTGKSTEFGISAQDLGQAASAAATAFSDERLKNNIVTSGHDAKGRRWVDFEYVWEPGVTHRGVIAQEVAKTDPDAVHVGPGGYLMVDYAQLGG